MLRLSIASFAGALLGAAVPVAAQAQSQTSELPDGAGKEVIAAVCTACHQTNQITRSSGYTADGWQELIGR
jgi:cytochrome c5